MKRLADWLDDRTGYRGLLHEALKERIPGGARWRYVWGSTLSFCFFVQLVTGLFLWLAYSPSSQTAWESVYYIQHQMQFGWLLRGLHHFTAQAMVVLLALHLMQVIIDGAYKAPREVNFWLGLVLLQITLGLSLTGYLLPWDQKGFWATQVATKLMTVVPLVGEPLQRLVVGGASYGHHTLTRFFAMHAGVLPGLLIGFLALHIAVFRRHGITVRDPIHRPDATFWPDQVLKDAVACLGVLAVVLFLTIWMGADLGAPADPAQPYAAARPEWYFLFLFQLLKYFPGETEVYGAVVIPGAVFLVMALMPLIGRWKLGHVFNVAYVFILLGGAGLLTAKALWDDSRGPDADTYRRAVAAAQQNATRVVELIEANGGIPAGGARTLLREDPKTAGPRLFARHCGVCHTYDGHDGAGAPVEKPTAADLASLGTREWLRSFIKDAGGERQLGRTPYANGAMAKWSKEHGARLTEEDLNAVVEFLFAAAGRADQPPVDASLAERGRDVFESGSLDPNADAQDRACLQCHELRLNGEALGSLNMEPGPDLSGYQSEKWLRQFLANPAADHNYGGRNAMPSFESRMRAQELELLVRWLMRDWPATK
jgi:ubiquinol-cytochrome c reductase cytochrome b subunit